MSLVKSQSTLDSFIYGVLIIFIYFYTSTFLLTFHPNKFVIYFYFSMSPPAPPFVLHSFNFFTSFSFNF